MSSYPEFKFYQNKWYPVGQLINIPGSNLKRLYPKKYLKAEEVLGFYMIYSPAFKSDISDKVSVTIIDHDTVNLSYSPEDHAVGNFALRGSLYVHSPGSLINISSATLGNDSVYAHMNLEVVIKTINSSKGVFYINEAFRSLCRESSIAGECRSVRILPYFSRSTDYQKFCTMEIDIPEESGGVILTQKTLSVSLNGEESPFYVFSDKNWIDKIDPEIFFSTDLSSVPEVIMG